MRIRHFSVICALLWTSSAGAQSSEAAQMPPQAPVTTASPNNYAVVAEGDRKFYEVSRLDRGTSKAIPETDIVQLCGDRDGCSIRMGMHNWDNTQRVASREFLFFYNPINKNWRSSYGDSAGTNADNIVNHPGSEIWACYFTDGEYKNWAGVDSSPNFGLLSWNQYNADCWMTVID